MQRICLLWLLCLLPVALAHAQGSEWDTLNAEVGKLYGEGKYDQAVIVAKKVLAVAEATVGPDHPNVATVLENLASLYSKTGDTAKQHACEARAKQIRAQAP